MKLGHIQLLMFCFLLQFGWFSQPDCQWPWTVNHFSLRHIHSESCLTHWCRGTLVLALILWDLKADKWRSSWFLSPLFIIFPIECPAMICCTGYQAVNKMLEIFLINDALWTEYLEVSDSCYCQFILQTWLLTQCRCATQSRFI